MYRCGVRGSGIRGLGLGLGDEDLVGRNQEL